MGDEAPLPTLAKLVYHSAAPALRTRHARAGIRRSQPVPLRPPLYPVRDTRQASPSSRSTHVRDGRIVHAVELEYWNVRPAGIARLDSHRRWLARINIVGDIKCARHWRKRRHALRQRRITSQHPHEPSPLGLTRGVDAIRVDAVTCLKLVEDLGGEADVVGLYTWNALPSFLRYLSATEDGRGRVGTAGLTLIPWGYTTM